MATTNKIFVQIDDKKIELTGADKEAFLLDIQSSLDNKAKFEAEMKAQKELKISAYKKLGLTDEEIAAII